MPTTHTWKPTNNGYILDPANYTDGTAFAPGDTLVVNGGGPGAQGSGGNVGSLTTGTYQFNPTGVSNSLQLVNVQLDAASTVSVVGPQVLTWQLTGQFVTDGTVQIGSAAASGSVLFKMFDYGVTPASVTNTGSIMLQNGSRFQTDPILESNDVFLNAAGAVLGINSGSAFYDPDPTAPIGGGATTNAAKIINNGLIAVNGAAGQTTKFYSQGDYSGTGLLSVRGVPGAAPADTFAQIEYGAASGTFDIASGELFYTKSPNTFAPLGATVNFLDANGQLTIKDGTLPGGGAEVNAAINGFQAGDRIVLQSYGQETGLTYDPATHRLAGRRWLPSAVAGDVHPGGQLHAGRFPDHAPADRITAHKRLV